MDLESKVDIGSELAFGFNVFNTTEIESKLVSMVRRIINLLLLEQGTLYDIREAGIGIQNYIFELATADTINELYGRIKQQIEVFLPDVPIKSIELEGDTVNADKKKKLYIKFELSKPIEGKTSVIFEVAEKDKIIKAYV
jgi:hypothetical protein